MKARVPYFTNKQMKVAEQQLRMEYAKVAQKERDNVTRRIFKVLCVALHEEFGFGKGRLARTIGIMTDMLEQSHNDEVFWEHVDREVIDYLDIPFERDYTVNGEPISETELTEKAKEKGGRKR